MVNIKENNYLQKSENSNKFYSKGGGVLVRVLESSEHLEETYAVGGNIVK